MNTAAAKQGQILFLLTERFPCSPATNGAELTAAGNYYLTVDSYEVCDDMDEANRLYEAAQDSEYTYIANIVRCIRSTDYDCEEII